MEQVLSLIMIQMVMGFVMMRIPALKIILMMQMEMVLLIVKRYLAV